jgi:hypothetical protein
MIQHIDNLQKFGIPFQIKCITTLLTDKKFLEQIHDIVELDFFENESLKWITKNILEYFVKYKNCITLDVFKVQINTIESDVLKASIVSNLKSVYTKIEDTDLTYVREQFLEFCKNQSLKKAIVNSIDLLNVGNYDQIKKEVDTALKAGAPRDLGHDYILDLQHRMSEMARNTVKTNWPLIDELLDGGLGDGELGVIVGSAGGGKCVGPNTEIMIKYHEFGLTYNGYSGKEYILWINPFKKYKIDNNELYGWQIESIIYDLNKKVEQSTRELENLNKK